MMTLLKKDSIKPSRITTDSRSVQPGQTFVAIQGDTFDGHQFIAQSIQKGATEIVAETAKLTAEIRASIPAGVTLTEVKSSLDEIRARAAQYRKQFNIPVIAVVGSVGKTTTKELIYSLLQGKFTGENEVLKTLGSQNGYLGIPLTLFTLSESTKIAVIEIGIDDIGAMEQHLKLVEPTHVILTTIGPEHLHQLKTVEIAAEEELKALDYALKHELPIALNLSDPFVVAWEQKNANSVTAHARKGLLKPYSLIADRKPQFFGDYHANKNLLTVNHSGQSIELPLPLPGEHHAHNLLAAVTLTQFFSLSQDQIKNGLATFKTAYGRTEIHILPKGTQIIGDYYNSNPTSAAAALKLLHQKTLPHGKSHAVLGDMLELGDLEESFHRALAASIIEEKVSAVWLYGPRMKWLFDELTTVKKATLPIRHFDSHEKLIEELKKALSEKDTVLIKGSRGMKMETVLKALL